MRVSTKHKKNLISSGTGLIHPFACTKAISMLWNYGESWLLRFTSTDFSRNKISYNSFKDKQIA